MKLILYNFGAKVITRTLFTECLLMVNFKENITIIILIRYADQVSIGDDVLVQEKDELTPAKVAQVSMVKAQGTYLATFIAFHAHSL